MKATEQYFPVVLFIMLYKVVLTFESVDKNSNKILLMLKFFDSFPVLNLGAMWSERVTLFMFYQCLFQPFPPLHHLRMKPLRQQK